MQTIKNYEIKVKRVRLKDTKAPNGATINGPNDVRFLARKLIGDSAQEHFLVFILDIKNRVIGYIETARGSIDSCQVDRRQVFRLALILGCSSIVVAHNHSSSGNCVPSGADIELTKIIKDGANILGIGFLDHIICSENDTYSFQEHDIMP